MLEDGRILAVGGVGVEGESLASAEVFDPAGGTWTAVGDLVEPRRAHTATLLQDGRVLVVAGSRNGMTPLSSAEVFDPTLGNWASAGSIADARWGHAAVLLPYGDVMVVGGFGFSALNAVETYRPGGGGWSSFDKAVRLKTPATRDAAVAKSGL
jgi:hypothetical protein